MTILTAEEMTLTQALIDENINRVQSLGLTMHSDSDLRRWKEHIEEVSGDSGASKTLDPDLNDVQPGNSFWVYLKDQKGKIVACHANRFLETDDFIQEYISTHRFFGNKCPTLHHFPIQFCEPVPVLKGRINFGAGTWVHPEFRGKSLGGLISHTGRTLALRHFLIDYYIAFIVATDRRRQYGANGLGLSNRRHLLTGLYPGRDGELDVDIYWMHRGEMMNQISREYSKSNYNADELMMRTA